MNSLLVCIPALVFGFADVDPAVDARFEAIGKRYIEQFPALSPAGATVLGDHRYDGQLDDVSAQSRDKAVKFYSGVLADLRGIDRAKLSRANQVDFEILEQSLRGDVWRLETLQDWAWNPLVYTELAGGSIYGLMAREFAPLSKRLEHVASRLEQFPRMLEQVRGTLVPKRVPPIHATTAVQQNKGVLSILANMVEPNVGQLAPAEQQRMRQALITARKAVDDHQKWLEKELVPNAGGDFRLGAKLFDQKLPFTLQTPLSRQQIRDRAESELRRVRAEMYGIAKEVYRKKHPYTEFPAEPSKEFQQAIIRAGLELACKDVPPADLLVERAKESLVETADFIREKDLMTLPTDPLDIIIMPEFQRGVSTAYCDAPGALDKGQKTFYAVAPLPADWNAGQIESYLREYNTRSLHNLTVHEAMPGHYVQLVISNRYPSTLRAVLSSGTFTEGWGCYAEQMMANEGYFHGDPLMLLVQRKWYLRAIANSILDQAIHVDGMNRDEAMKLMIEETFQEEREAAGKWVRAQLTSTQLSTYFVGVQEHLDLRRDAERRWGKEFTKRRYHDQVVSFGSPPVRFVRALMFDLEIPRIGE
ncbi:MAG: DUF885 domain-containing protein [Planctomycetota bacterium]|nr:DUF885 domain-containing protein [Planctomycetota bacterium]